MTILEETRHSLIIIDHDPLLNEDATGTIELVSEGLKGQGHFKKDYHLALLARNQSNHRMTTFFYFHLDLYELDR
jgi:hypothetical protein